MSTISEELVKLINTKAAIKQSLTNKGKEPSDFFDTYAINIDEIESISNYASVEDMEADIENLEDGAIAEVDDDVYIKVTKSGTSTMQQLVNLQEATSDATATTDRIYQGYSAYVKGNKVTGTLNPTGTAKAGNVLTGKTFYYGTGLISGTAVNLTGTYQMGDKIKVDNVELGEIGSSADNNSDTTYSFILANRASNQAQQGFMLPCSNEYGYGNYFTVQVKYSKIMDTLPTYLKNNAKALIKSGSSLYGLEGTFTSDADAVATDILDGKTAYVDGEKITGTYVPLDTSDADATADNIDQGKTAYVNGEKITGTSTKVDTSDANATSADIAAGKTAYVNGQKITGIGAMTFATIAEMNTVTNIPEDTLAIVYGTDYVGTYRFDNGSWTEIGSKSVEQQSMDNLNALDGSTDQYEGLGGTEEQVNEVLDEIIEGSQEESGTTNGKHSGD